MEMRAAMQEKEESKAASAKSRSKVTRIFGDKLTDKKYQTSYSH